MLVNNITNRMRVVVASLILVAAALLALSFPIPSFASGKNIATVAPSPVQNQLVEVALQCKSGGEFKTAFSKGEAAPDVLNENGKFEFGDPNGDGTYSFPDNISDGYRIVYSFGAKPTITLKDGTYELEQGVDYDLAYEANENVGPAWAVATGKGDYTGTVKVPFEIIGYRVVPYTVGGNGGNVSVNYGWGSEQTWPAFTAKAISTSNRFECIVKTTEGTFVSVNQGIGKDEERLGLSVDIWSMHPGISTDADENGNYSDEYIAFTTAAERAIATPIDTGTLYPSQAYLEANPSMPEWELQHAHFPTLKNDSFDKPKNGSAEWSLKSLFEIAAQYPKGWDDQVTFFYEGADSIKHKKLQNVSDFDYSLRLKSGVAPVLLDLMGLTAQEAENLVNVDRIAPQELSDADNTPLGKYTFPGYSFSLSSTELMSKLGDLVSDSRYFETEYNGKPVTINTSSVTAVLANTTSTTSVGKKVFTVVPYDLSELDDTDGATEYTGNHYKELDYMDYLVTGSSVINNLGNPDITLATVPHGSTIVVNNDEPLRFTGGRIEPILSVKTKYQENILDDIFAEEGVDYSIRYYKLTDGDYREVEVIDEVGSYKVEIEGLATGDDLYDLPFYGDCHDGVPYFIGKASQEFEVVELSIATDELSHAIDDAKSSKENATEPVVAADELGDKEDGFQYRSEESADALDKAIADAESALVNPQDQTVIDDALKKLQDALTAFEVVTHKVNVDDLKAAQEDAQAKLASTSPSSDGGKTSTDGKTLAKGDNWSNADDYEALKAKADDAKAVLDKEEGQRGATQNQVDDMAKELSNLVSSLAVEEAEGPADPTPEKTNLMDATVSLKMASFEYDGEHAITMSNVLQEVLYKGNALQQDKDFQATFKGKDDNKEYASITSPGDYLVVITGIGDYTGEAKKSFSVTKASGDPLPSGLTVQTSATDDDMVYLTGYRDGQQVELKGWTTVPQNVAIVTDTNKDGVLEAAFQAPGAVTITVQTADGDSAKVVLVSSLAPEGEDVETTKLVDDASGVEVDGVSKKAVDENGLRLVVKSGEEAGRLSNVDTTIEGQRSLGIHDVRLYIGDTEVQPAGKLTISFPVDVTEVPDGMRMLAYHWHGSATTPKELSHEGIQDGKVNFSVRELSPFEVALLKDGASENDISHATVVDLKSIYFGTSGKPLDLGVSLVLNGKTLVNGTDYSVEFQKLSTYSNSYEIVASAWSSGVYKLKFTGKGDYTGVLLSNPFNVVVDGDYTGIDPDINYGDGQVSDPDRNEQNLGSNNSGSGSLSDTGTKGSSLAQTGDRQLINLLVLMATICGAGGVSLISRKRSKIVK